MKTQLNRILLLHLLLFLFFQKASAYTFDWKGTSSSNWATASNWTRTGSGGTSTYPGQTGSVDIVRIGVSNFTANQPTLSASVSVASVEFGDNNGNSITLTVNTAVVLTVTGAVVQDHNASNGGITTTVTGTGTATLICSSLTVGDGTVPPAPNGDSLFGGNLPTNNTTTFNCNIAILTVNGDLTLHSTASALATWTFFFVPIASNYSVNNPWVNLNSGTLTINNMITTNGFYVSRNDGYFYVQTIAVYKMDLGASSNTLNLLGANPITTATAGTMDFVSGGTVTASTVNYAATSGTQTVYTSADAFANATPTVYPNLILSAASAKTVHSGTLSIGSDLTTSGGAVNLNTNNTIVTVADDWTNSATITQGTGNISTGGDLTNTGTLTLGTGNLTVTGNYTNNGTYTQSTGNTIFNGASPTLNDGGSGTIFNNATFSGSGTALLNSGNFSVSGTGILTMVNTNILNANGHLTLISTAASSATVAPIPSTCSITGNVTVQRYITGGSITYRGYRLLSSPVYAATVGGNHVYSINYLKNSIYLTGTTTAGGFDNTAVANPTLYLYRENLAPAYTTFLNSNYKGINNINSAPTYLMDDASNPSINIPVGNGFLCWIRGNRATATFTTETQTSYIPQTVTLSCTGTLNQGTITAPDWFTPGNPKLSFSGSTITKGYNLVGNPYASSIDWETFDTSNNSHLSSTIYEFDPVSHNYGAYMQGSGGIGTNNASNIIVSGQGFFVMATSAAAKMIFDETNKTNTQIVTPKLLMGTPADIANNQYLRIQLAMDSTNTEDILIRFNNNASTLYSQAIDAPYLQGFGEVNLSSLSSDSVSLAINTRPLPKDTTRIALKINTKSDGTYSLNIKNIAGIPQLFDIWLMDAFKKDSLDMRHNTTYTFNVLKSDTNTFGSKRFSLVIRQNPAYVYHLLDFAAAKVLSAMDKEVQVTWKAENEQNYTHFTVERSIDSAKTFEVIGGVQASAQATYSLLDKAPVIGQNLYRLKQEDINDNISYSKIVPIAYADLSNSLAKNTINVYPNPAKSIINLAITADINKAASYNIMITNSSGLIIKQATSAQPEWQASINDLLPGTYLVKVINNKDNSFVGNAKFVKM